MSDRLPYEEQLPQHLRDFPLPDENAAWADMKRRLDEDDDDGAIVWWRKGCALWAGLLLIAALLITGWWYFSREKNDRIASGQAVNDQPITENPRKNLNLDTLSDGSQTPHTGSVPALTSDTLDKYLHGPLTDTISSARKRGAAISKLQKQQKQTSSIEKNDPSNEQTSSQIISSKKTSDTASVKRPAKRSKTPAPALSTTTGTETKQPPVTSVNNPTADSIRRFIAGDTLIAKRETTITSPQAWPLDSIRAFVTGDTTSLKRNDSIPTAGQSWPIDSIKAFVTGDTLTHNTADSTISKTDSLPLQDSSINKTDTTEKEYFLSAGLALTQQLPIAGQKAVPYASQGRDFSLADYIPSVYFRFNKKHRWFIQGEFRYGAPQYTKPITYSIESDTSGTALIARTERSLLKTYYHQLPISFNYYITRNWSLGAGLVWNRFSKSIFEEDQLQRNPLSPFDTFHVKETMVSKDPAREGLSRSYFQGLIESQYQWKKFSFGGRYTFGLSPYLRFTLPGEAERKERNQSLQFFIRYDIWRKSLKN
jgi:hypothetical protein